MSGRQVIRATIDLTLDAERRPTGLVHTGGSTPTEFTGWVSLMSELTRLLAAAGDGPRPDLPADSDSNAR